jgi:hypothetical protein
MAGKQKWYVSSPKMTVQVDTDNLIVTKAANVVSMFKGQPFNNLIRWMEKRFGKIEVKELKP